jgi:disease resistance protein RPS2
LECHFKGHSDLEKFFNSRDKTRSLKTCKICVGQFEENDGYNVKTCCRDNAVEFGNLSVNKDRDFQETFPRTNNGGSMESLASSPWFWSGPLTLTSYNGIFSGLKEFFFFWMYKYEEVVPSCLPARPRSD